MRFKSSIRRPKWTTITSTLVLTLGATALVLSAVFANGFPVRQVALNDGGVWVTSDQDGLYGRLNKPAGSLDAAFYPPGGVQKAYALDVFQDGAAVAAWDRSTGRLFPVDVKRGVTVGDQGLPVSAGRQMRLSGNTIAVLDPASGNLWASRVDPVRGVSTLADLDQGKEPLASVGSAEGEAAAALAVGLDGTVYALSAAGKLATLKTAPGTGFTPPEYRDLGRRTKSPQLAAVGDRLAILDTATGDVSISDGGRATVATDAVLQASGPTSSAVVLATSKALVSMDLTSGKVSTLSDLGGGSPAAPVRLDDCIHAAWAGTAGGYVRSCGGAQAKPGNLKNAEALVRPEFRVNRGLIVLNDKGTGRVWDLSNQSRVDNWSSVRPPPIVKPGDKKKDTDTKVPVKDRPPKAVDDTVGARAGRTTLLYLLDNDSDPAGNILSISGITPPDNPNVRLSIAPDGQTVAVSMPSTGASVHFTYTVDDGNLTATASVSVVLRGPGENKAPELRPNFIAAMWTVPSGGVLSAPVLADWRDFDGDPVTLAGASAKAGSVTTTQAGFVEYTAPAAGGPQKVAYEVTDGLSEPVPGAIDVMVQRPDATTAVAAITQPDVARGQIGQPISVYPLDNDLPGSDPATRGAKLALAGELASPANTTVVTDLRTGHVTLTATRAGPYLLEYTAAFGNAPFAKGAIRVDVVPAPTSPAPPVAMPDSAVLRGQAATTVDVLANDFDPSGSVLVLEQAAPVDPDSRLQVAIVQGHWLRINALTAAVGPVTQLVRYTVTNGITAPVTGEVAVTRLPNPPDTAPVPKDDYTTVRAGDSVTIPVLDNDTNPGGQPMTLAANVAGAPGPGRLKLTPPVPRDENADGAAYVIGNLVRYVAPATIAVAQQTTVDYVVQNPDGDQAIGRLHVTVVPAPAPANPNHPPAPLPVEARAVAGQTVVLTLATSGIDVDGDTASVTGLATAPALGRIVAVNATSLSYQAFPTSAGTDTFDYLMTDRFGAVGRSTIRIGISPPGPPQPPVAIDDEVTAAPGARLRLDVLANDLRSPDDTVTIQPLGEHNPGLGNDIKLASETGPIELVAPDLTGKPLVVHYAITNGIGEPSVGILTVHSQKDYNIPPVAFDAYPIAEAKATSITVDLLGQCDDPDGLQADLVLTKVFDPKASVSGWKVTLPVTDRPYTVAYEVKDDGGATAVGLVHVPAPGSGGPYVKSDARIEVPRNGTKTVALGDYVVDPAGLEARLTTTDKIWAAPAAALKAESQGSSRLLLTAGGDYSGPGALTIEVTNGSSLADPNAVVRVITIPVQIGPETPVLHCPAEPLRVVEGGTTLKVNVTSVCHVWVADRRKLPDLKYSASWKEKPDAVTLTGSGEHVLGLTAGSTAVPGATGRVDIKVVGYEGATAQISVRVVAAAPASISPIVVKGLKAGDTATVDLTPYVRSQLAEPAISVVGVAQTSAIPGNATANGATVQIAPGAEAKGVMTFSVTVTDVPDRARTDRYVAGLITVHVLGVPDAPAAPVVGHTVLSRSVELSWPTPANNGAPIEVYDVAYSGGTQTCPGSPCLITGLTNGVGYTFTVRARNLVGWGKPSPASAVAQPNTVPGAVTGIVASNPQDGTLQLNWTAPVNDGTPVLRYEMSWSGGGHAVSSTTGLTASGLDNNAQYTFTIIAVNAQGPGPSATVQGQSAGAPPQPPAPNVSSVDSADKSTRAVTISWPAVDPNGPGPTTYTVTRTGAGTKTVCADVTVRSCPDDGLANDGTMYTYTLVAANAAAVASPAGHTSPPSPGTQMEAAATPGPITNLSATPTGSDGQATLTFDVPPSHGASSTVTCTYSGGSCGSWSYPTAGQNGVSQTVNGLPNGQGTSLSLRDCNGSSTGNPCGSPVSVGVTTYGPLKNLNISTSANGPNVNFTVSVDPNGRPATVHVQTSRQTQTFTTGVGAWSWSSSDNVGYSSSDTITVTVSDPGRASLNQQRTQSTPPPPPTVTVSKGTACGGGGGPACAGGTCISSSCAYIRVQTANFGGNVTCTFNSQHGSGGFYQSGVWGANQTKDSANWYGYPGEWVSATCGGVTGTFTWY